MLIVCKYIKNIVSCSVNSSKFINNENPYQHQNSDFDGIWKFADVSTRLEILKRDIEIEEVKKYVADRIYDVKKKEICIQSQLDRTNTVRGEQLAIINRHNSGGIFLDLEQIDEVDHSNIPGYPA